MCYTGDVCFSLIGRMKRNAACSFLPVLFCRTTMNPDLTSLHKVLAAIGFSVIIIINIISYFGSEVPVGFFIWLN